MSVIPSLNIRFRETFYACLRMPASCVLLFFKFLVDSMFLGRVDADGREDFREVLMFIDPSRPTTFLSVLNCVGVPRL